MVLFGIELGASGHSVSRPAAERQYVRWRGTRLRLVSFGILGSVLIAALFTACAADVGPPGYQEAAREARVNMLSMKGRFFRRRIERDLKTALKDIMERCYRVSRDTRGARLLLLINADGELSRFLIYPESAFSSCISENLAIPKLVPPPEPDYWIKIQLAPHSRAISYD
jgi:hypothetical protein